MSTGPVESKVKSAAFGAALAGVAVWALETYFFRGAVPVPIRALIDITIPALAAFGLGYAANHTYRTDPDARTGPAGTVPRP